MRVYIGEMFPLPGHAAAALLNAAAVFGFVQTLAAQDRTSSDWLALGLAFWNIFAVHLLLRLMDELKDKEIDQLLFPERPLPSGRVLEADIRISLTAMLALYLAANSFSGAAFATALAVVAYAALMYKRFFKPELLKDSLPLTLLTHTPIIPLNLLQVVVSSMEASGAHLQSSQWPLVLLYLLMVWLAVLGWELSRKIRAAEEETAYVTYSQILGRSGAVAATLAVQSLSGAIALFFYFDFALDWPYLALLLTGYGVSLAGHVYFLLRPDRRTSKLKRYAYGFITALLLAQVYGFGIWN